MSDATDKSPSPAPSLKKQKKTPWMIIGVVIVIVVALIAVVVLGGFLNSETDVLKKVKNRGQLIVGTQIPYKPFEYQNTTSGAFEGIDMEIAQKIADSLNVTLVVKTMDFDPLFGAVQTGQIDMAISSITITAQRQLTSDFSVPYYIANQSALVRDSSSINNIDGLNGTKVVAQLGTTGADWVQTNLIDTGRITAGDYSDYSDVAQAVTAVQTSQKDVFIVDYPVAHAYAVDPNNNVKIGFVIPTNEHYGICINKNQDDFRNAVNNVITKMQTDGSMSALLHKYHAD